MRLHLRPRTKEQNVKGGEKPFLTKSNFYLLIYVAGEPAAERVRPALPGPHRGVHLLRLSLPELCLVAGPLVAVPRGRGAVRPGEEEEECAVRGEGGRGGRDDCSGKLL